MRNSLSCAGRGREDQGQPFHHTASSKTASCKSASLHWSSHLTWLPWASQPGQGWRPSRSRASPAQRLCWLKPTFCSISEQILFPRTAAGAATSPRLPATTEQTARAGAGLCPRCSGRACPAQLAPTRAAAAPSPAAPDGRTAVRRQPGTLLQPPASSTAARGCRGRLPDLQTSVSLLPWDRFGIFARSAAAR